MRDGEYLFHLSQREHKHSGAFHKRNGSKSKKCSLPSDNLTAKQRKELNGPMKTYNLKKPMSWEEFKSLPNDLKKEYLLFLNRTYHASARRIAEMFGVPKNTLYYYVNSFMSDPRFTLVGFRKPTWEWELFKIGARPVVEEVTEPTENEEAPVPAEPTLLDQIDAVLVESEAPVAEAPKEKTKPALVVSEINMTAVGTAEDLAFLLKSSLKPEQLYKLSFTAQLVGGEVDPA